MKSTKLDTSNALNLLIRDYEVDGETCTQR